MRILQIGPIPPEVGGATFGGVANHLWSLARHLATRGHVVGVLADNARSWHGPRAIEGVRVHPRRALAGLAELCRPSAWPAVARTRAHLDHLASRRTVWLAAAYRRVLRRFAPDVVHVHHLERRFPAAYYARPRSVPILATIHSTSSLEFGEPSDGALHRLWRRNLALSEHVLFVSQFVQRRVETLFPDALPAGADRWVVPNPVDVDPSAPMTTPPEARAGLGLAPDVPLALFAGRLVPLKSVDTLVAATKRLTAQGQRLQVAIVGDGPDRARLEELVADAGLSGVVAFHGWKPRQELARFYACADVLVIPSRMESFGLVFIEGMFHGCPVLGSPEVLSEILPGPAYGRAFPPGDAEALAAVMGSALHLPWDRHRIREFALAFSWDTRIAAYERIYRHITGSHAA